LSRSAGIDCSKEPGSKYTENKEVKTLSYYGHLKEASEDCEMHNRFGGLTVIGGAKTRHKR